MAATTTTTQSRAAPKRRRAAAPAAASGSRSGAGPAPRRRPGLRDRKKAETERTILEQAARLFDEAGYEQTSIADIAAAANVSAKTIQNYFPHKRMIAYRVYWPNFLRAEKTAEALARLDHADPVEGLMAVAEPFWRMYAKADRALVREAIAAFLTSPAESDEDFTNTAGTGIPGLIETVLLRCRAQGTLVYDGDMRDLVRLIFRVGSGIANSFIRIEGMSAEEVLAEVRRSYEIILKGWVPEPADRN